MAAIATVLTCVVLAPVGAAATPVDNAVQRWNATTLTALFASPAAAVPGAGQAPTVGVIHMAMVQGAVFDAVNSIVGKYESYLDVPDAKAGASVSAAVITAAHDVLIEVIPMSDASIRDAILARIEEQYTTELAAIPSGPAKRRGVAAGAAAAATMLAERAEDGRFPADPFMFTPGTGIGEWRPTNEVNDPFAWIARVRPFALRSASQFRTAGPNPVTSEAYAAEYNEVKTLGAATDSSRTQEQTALATFYLANPVEMFNRTFRTIAADEGLGQVKQARLFAMLNVAAADAAINCWDDKAEYNYWRPVTAIHLGDEDDNPATEGDASWQPLISSVPGAQPGSFLVTPPYPEHPSGYNCIAAALIHAGRRFFGTNEMSFTVTRIAGTSTISRDYTTFTAVIQDTIDARVFLGIHFRAADVQGAILGKKVARWVAERFFEPEDR
jgi:hypothetical protein